MSVKILIKRKVPEDKIRNIIPLFRQMRNLAMDQPGYISGETLKKLDVDEFMVISSWQSSADWNKWIQTKERNEIQQKIDELIGGKTEYEIFHYGFKE
ncbi:MAG: antibiotic biosynthesis monooxygenase [Desulfobacteraceae bacterium]|nr:antibiotic biosynthesis monooxygenase [Desulfobacteraceae bacterium]MCP4345445.1 antibiotic biosynthesis monooxygenase [Desulfobacterales bacterium]